MAIEPNTMPTKHPVACCYVDNDKVAFTGWLVDKDEYERATGNELARSRSDVEFVEIFDVFSSGALNSSHEENGFRDWPNGHMYEISEEALHEHDAIEVETYLIEEYGWNGKSYGNLSVSGDGLPLNREVER